MFKVKALILIFPSIIINRNCTSILTIDKTLKVKVEIINFKIQTLLIFRKKGKINYIEEIALRIKKTLKILQLKLEIV
jgi:hypothetical protein